ncbi:hypothetical protein [Mariniluteicoccus flavus]
MSWRPGRGRAEALEAACRQRAGRRVEGVIEMDRRGGIETSVDLGCAVQLADDVHEAMAASAFATLFCIVVEQCSQPFGLAHE